MSKSTRILRQRGQSTVEYVVICVALAAALFASHSSVGQQLTQAIRTFYADLTFFFSLP
jgi:Flp pilus assembly pilin Flp